MKPRVLETRTARCVRGLRRDLDSLPFIREIPAADSILLVAFARRSTEFPQRLAAAATVATRAIFIDGMKRIDIRRVPGVGPLPPGGYVYSARASSCGRLNFYLLIRF
jgi:hypothetical protein